MCCWERLPILAPRRSRMAQTRARSARCCSPSALRVVQLALGMDPGASYPFAYPPSYLPLLWLLGRLPGWLSCVGLIGITLPLYLWSIFGRDWRLAGIAAVLAAPTTATMVVS